MNIAPSDAKAAGLALALPAAVAAQTFTAAMMFAPPVLAPAAAADVGLPATMVGVVTALIYLSAAVIAPAAGARVPRIGALRVTQTGYLNWNIVGIVGGLIFVLAVVALGAAR